MPPQVTITDDTVTITKADGSLLTINKVNIVDASALAQNLYTASQSGSTAMDSVTNYKMALHLADNRVEVLDMGTVSDQSEWTDTVLGANQAVQDVFGGGTPPPPFVCAGPGYGSFTVGDIGTIVSTVTTDGYLTTRNSSTEVVDTQAVGAFVGAGSYCLWASDNTGVVDGDLETLVFADLGDPITQLDTSGYAGLKELEVDNGAFGPADVSNNLLLEIIVMYYDAAVQNLVANVAIKIISLSSPNLVSVPLPPTNAIEQIIIDGNLPDTEVNAILANAVTNGMTGGIIGLQYAGNAAPTGQGLLDKAYLQATVPPNTVTTN